MKKAVSFLFSVLFFLASSASTTERKTIATLPVDQIKAGMKGVAYTVYEGTQPEQLAVEVVGVLKKIEAPFVFSGFSEDALKRFAPQLTAAGVAPVMAMGGVSDQKQPEPIVAGSAVSAVLVHGDMDIAATCTVTYADADHLLACGHPLLQYGMVDIPMTKANVVMTLS